MFDYMMVDQSEQFSFIRIPKMMLTDDLFSKISLQAKVLYGLLLDRMGKSMENQWLDQEGRVYIIYPVNEIQEDTSLSKRKILDYLAELVRKEIKRRKRRLEKAYRKEQRDEAEKTSDPSAVGKLDVSLLREMEKKSIRYGTDDRNENLQQPQVWWRLSK